MTVCRRHRGNLSAVKAKAARRISEITMPVLESMYQAATQKENLGAAVKAGIDLLDRGEVGALVQAKVRSSNRAEGTRIDVRIGFLGFLNAEGSSGPIVVVPSAPEPGEE